jgi:hypothetical protein
VIQDWTLAPGDTIRRKVLHDQFGGGRQGGIEPSAKSPNVLLFTSKVGQEFGYNFDGWHSDGTFHYTGEGRYGDQKMTYGNRAVLEHHAQGRAIRLFEKDGTDVIYIGEFEIPNESHVLLDEAPDADGEKRSVFVFRLKPVGPNWIDSSLRAPPEVLYKSIQLEATNVEQFVAHRQGDESTILLRREALLVGRYVGWLAKTGITKVSRQSIPTPAGHLMYTDLFVQESGELIEAKASSSRHHVRTALGQILDYGRYVEHSRLAVLTPTKPDGEMITLLNSYGVSSIWEDSRKFTRLSPANVWG